MGRTRKKTTISPQGRHYDVIGGHSDGYSISYALGLVPSMVKNTRVNNVGHPRIPVIFFFLLLFVERLQIPQTAVPLLETVSRPKEFFGKSEFLQSSRR